MTDRIIDTDVLVVGSEGAGARAAIEAARYGAKVTIATKGQQGLCGATVTAGTDIDADSKSIIEVLGLPGDTRDSKEMFFKDMLVEGRYVNDQKITWKHVEDAPIRIKELMDWGMQVSARIGHAQGHTYPRGVLSTGREVMKALMNEIERYRDRVEVIEDTMVTDLLTHKRRVVGATALNLRTGEFVVFRAKAVILATGGGLRIWPYTTGPEDLTGDGQAMAYRVGAEIWDPEFVQFLATTFTHPPTTVTSVNVLLFSSSPWLINRYGERFMKKWDPQRMEKSTRDLISIGIMNEILEGRGWEDERGGWVHQSKRLSHFRLPVPLLSISGYQSSSCPRGTWRL